ncbi:PREDICTED: uncharacterized protein LOC102010672 [Chinchilla lanigera]|uniref:uncharacterized protein LOC102010672 n=1 Tax=Chinchilla lanigera TaxID=34839 RepID=UPI00038ED77F|nr:PREDICTED: uncharacterized protein LOC102010672 [Chinchilla lanigera]
MPLSYIAGPNAPFKEPQYLLSVVQGQPGDLSTLNASLPAVPSAADGGRVTEKRAAVACFARRSVLQGPRPPTPKHGAYRALPSGQLGSPSWSSAPRCLAAWRQPGGVAGGAGSVDGSSAPVTPGLSALGETPPLQREGASRPLTPAEVSGRVPVTSPSVPACPPAGSLRWAPGQKVTASRGQRSDTRNPIPQALNAGFYWILDPSFTVIAESTTACHRDWHHRESRNGILGAFAPRLPQPPAAAHSPVLVLASRPSHCRPCALGLFALPGIQLALPAACAWESSPWGVCPLLFVRQPPSQFSHCCEFFLREILPGLFNYKVDAPPVSLDSPPTSCTGD